MTRSVPKEVAEARARRAALARHRGPFDPAAVDAATELRMRKLEDYIQRVVAAAPPLTADQKSRLSLMLAGA